MRVGEEQRHFSLPGSLMGWASCLRECWLGGHCISLYQKALALAALPGCSAVLSRVLPGPVHRWLEGPCPMAGRGCAPCCAPARVWDVPSAPVSPPALWAPAPRAARAPRALCRRLRALHCPARAERCAARAAPGDSSRAAFLHSPSALPRCHWNTRVFILSEGIALHS